MDFYLNRYNSSLESLNSVWQGKSKADLIEHKRNTIHHKKGGTAEIKHNPMKMEKKHGEQKVATSAAALQIPFASPHM
jgi:hypothetical protein